MKKTTLTLFTLLLTFTLFGQNYTTGTLNLTVNYTAKVDVNATTNIVTLTLNGPSDRYFGFGFSTSNMQSGNDCVIYTGTAGTGLNVLSDRTFAGNQMPTVDSGTNTQSWNVTTNSVSGNTRTIIATRPRISTGDFTFPTTAGSINFAWSHAQSASYALQYHGGGNRGGVVAQFTLGAENFKFETFTMYPNPTKNIVNIDLPNQIESGVVKIYDSLGRVVKNKTVSKSDNQIIIEDLTTGAYMVVVRTEYGNSTKTLLVE